MIDEQRIGPGMDLYRYRLEVGGGALTARLLVVDLENPHVEVRAISPSNGFNNRQTVRAMASTTDAVAAVNADLFHLTRPAAPFGPHVERGTLLSSPTSNAYSRAFGIDDSGRAHIRYWPFAGRVHLGGVSHPLAGYNQTYVGSDGGLFLYDGNWGTEVSASFFTGPVVAATVSGSLVSTVDVTTGSVHIPPGGYALVGEGSGGEFLRGVARAGSHFHHEAGLSTSMRVETAVGGHSLIVDEGRPLSSLSSPGATRASRSALGIDPEGRILRLVTVDGTPSVAGLTMGELAEFMSRTGSHRALNLDGGGSTSMAVRYPGEFDPVLASTPGSGFERSVPNALGIYNVARPSAPDTILVDGPTGMLAGTEVTYRVTAHDANYLPVRVGTGDVRWEVSDPSIAGFEGNTLSARSPGEILVRASLGSVDRNFSVKIFGGEDIQDILVTPRDLRMLSGQSVRLSARVVTNTGVTLDAGPDTVSWSTDFGRIEGNVYHAPDVEGFGTLTADIDGHTKEVPIRIGGRREPFFTFREWQTASFRSYPEGLGGSFEIITDPAYSFRGERSGRLAYDFSGEAATMIAYGQLGSGQISMGENNVGVSAYIMGDASGYELRGEIVDAGGRSRHVVLSESIDWQGWVRVSGAIDPGWPQPLTLSSIYLLREEGVIAEDAPRSGAIYIDQIEMIKGLEEDATEELADVRMWIGSTAYSIRGQAATMDAAPFIQSGRTLIPVRYIAEAFGARAGWTSNPDTGATQTVTLTADDIVIYIEIGQRELTVANRYTGAQITHALDVSPVIVDGRTYLPFRAIGELGFGAEVDYSLHPETGAVDCVWLNLN